MNRAKSDKQKKPKSYKTTKHWVFFLFLLPTLLTFLVFVIIPFVLGIYYSMTTWTGLNTGREEWIWFQNYVTVFSDYGFAYSFLRTVIYSVLNIFAINLVAFGLALLVTQNIKIRNIARAGFFLPNLIGGLILGYIWQFIFNNALESLGGAFSPSVLVSGETALFGLIIVVTWQYAGYIMMIYIAALQNVPQDLIEAASIDGANVYQRLRNITLPLVAQAFTIALFLTLVTSFKQFDTVVSLTQGGPATQLPVWMANLYGLDIVPVVQSTNLIAMNIYAEAFTYTQMGIGQAKAIIFFTVLIIFSLTQVYFSKKREVEL